ncbi:type II secretion system F family protein [Corynebacterium sp. NPDC060344]|uniref:type II secretion system F family protein n=1 Tax=Corynebacterium sp. NPDC060344 TaxID=3347101 RepID=UPI003647522D
MTLAMFILAAVALIPTGVRASERWPELGRGGGDSDSRATAGRGGESPEIGPRLPAFIRSRVGGGSRTPDPMRLLDAASALDLLAACLAAGMPPGEAASATASAASPRLSGPLHDVSLRLSLGVSSPWAVLDEVPEMADLVALARRSGDSGAAMSAGVAELAVARRAAAGDGAEATAERAGVLIAGPLALCFLPAFVVLGLIPTIAGLAESMLGSLAVGPS